MAPKNAEVIQNALMESSSEEEESGSSGEESESSAESENESDSGSDSEPAKKNDRPVVTSESAATLRESSMAKRPLQQAEPEGNKKLKKSATEDVKKAKTDNEVKKISGEEPESSAEDSKKDESNLESDSENESDSGSDSEPAKKNDRPVVISGSAATLPGSSMAKRPLQQAEPEGNKKLKISATEDVKKAKTNNEVKKISGEEAKKMFQRLFSETDEIALLQGIIDFTATKGDPNEDSDAFCVYVKKLIDFNATKSQIVTKLQRLKKKFVNIVKNSLKKGKSEDEIVFSKDLDQKSFELSRKIWGSNGVLASKSRKKLGGTLKETKPAGTTKETKLKPLSSPEKQQVEIEKTEPKVVNTGVSIAREIALFFCAENASVCGLDEATIIALCEKFPEGEKKRVIEEKWKKLKAKNVELCLERTECVNETAKMLFKT